MTKWISEKKWKHFGRKIYDDIIGHVLYERVQNLKNKF